MDTQANSRLKLLTLNIWNRQGDWDRRRSLIRDGITALAPDIVALQEVLAMVGEPTQADEIAADLGYAVAYGEAWRVGGGLHFGNAVLSRYPVIATDNQQLPGAPRDQDRALLYALVDTPWGPVPTFNTHLSWKLHHSHVRVEQVKSIAKTISQLAPMTGLPPVLMGDMNAEPDSDEMRYLRGLTALGGPKSVYMADCWLCCNPESPHLGFTYARDNAQALRTREPNRRIDYIFVRGPDRALRGEPLVSRVVFTEAKDGIHASDHYGVYAEVAVAARRLDPY